MLLAVGRHCGVIRPTSAVTYVFILYSESTVLSLTVKMLVACNLHTVSRVLLPEYTLRKGCTLSLENERKDPNLGS